MRILLSILLSTAALGILLFCVFGFMATLEPMDLAVQVTWRIIYGVIGTGCVGGLVWVWRGFGRN